MQAAQEGRWARTPAPQDAAAGGHTRGRQLSQPRPCRSGGAASPPPEVSRMERRPEKTMEAPPSTLCRLEARPARTGMAEVQQIMLASRKSCGGVGSRGRGVKGHSEEQDRQATQAISWRGLQGGTADLCTVRPPGNRAAGSVTAQQPQTPPFPQTVGTGTKAHVQDFKVQVVGAGAKRDERDVDEQHGDAGPADGAALQEVGGDPRGQAVLQPGGAERAVWRRLGGMWGCRKRGALV
jgi:hypothetical protein